MSKFIWFFVTLCTDACKFTFSFYMLQLRQFFYLENESFCLCSMPKGLHFMSLWGATSPNKKRRMWVIGHNTVSMRFGNLLLARGTDLFRHYEMIHLSAILKLRSETRYFYFKTCPQFICFVYRWSRYINRGINRDDIHNFLHV